MSSPKTCTPTADGTHYDTDYIRKQVVWQFAVTLYHSLLCDESESIRLCYLFAFIRSLFKDDISDANCIAEISN
jgi:hypothetical protein